MTVNSIDRKTVSANGRSTEHRAITYLACPYTHPDENVRKRRFAIATKVAAALIEQGYIVYSPVTMTHPIDSVLAGELGTLGPDYWVAFDRAFMDVCSELIIIQLDDWRESQGIRQEIKYFQQQGKPIRFVNARSEFIDAEL